MDGRPAAANRERPIADYDVRIGGWVSLDDLMEKVTSNV